MTQLKQFLIRRIKTEGPMSVAAYMAECLFNPKHGYYVKNEPFGADGDFITAPDISQMFGELTASWLIQAWQDLGKPNPVTLCEIGPGRGVWMQWCLALGAYKPAKISQHGPCLSHVNLQTLLCT